MIIIGLVLLVCLGGLALYLITEKTKPAEVGRIMFAMGLLALLLGGGVQTCAAQIQGGPSAGIHR